MIILEQDFTDGCKLKLQFKYLSAKAIFDKLNLLKALGIKIVVKAG